jgi:S1/P1 Nuclease
MSAAIKITDSNGNLRSTNLHSYWDSGVESFPKGGPNFAPPPLSQIPPAAASAMKANPPNASGLKLNDPFNFPAWATESFSLAKDVAYKGMSNGIEPNAAYKSKGQKVARQRAAWGGYRLAALLNSIWP